MAKKTTTLLNQVATKYEEKYNGKSTASSFFFPEDDIPLEEKSKPGWFLAWQQALFSLFVRGFCYNTPDSYEDLQLLRLYGAGMQPNAPYQNLMLGAEQQGGAARRAWLSTDWEIFNPAPKLHREIRGRLERQEHDYVATAVDPTSQAVKEDQKWDVWYNSQYGEKEAEIMQLLNAKVDESSKYIAQSLEELDMFNSMGGFKLKAEAELETVLDMTDYLSDIKTIKQKCIDDLVDWNKAAFRDYYDPVSGLVLYKYIDWRNLIIDYSHEKDFKDGRFWSYIEMETINNIRARAPHLEEADLMRIASQNCGMWGNMDRGLYGQYEQYNYCTEKGIRIYDSFRIPVLISEWISTDTEYKLKQKSKTGQTKYYDQTHGKIYDTPTKKTKVTRKNNVYQSTWVIGSDIVYDYGKSLNTARPDPKNPKLSIHAVAIPGKSIIQSAKPVLDQLQLLWVKKQSAYAQAYPNGTEWNLDAMENVTVGGIKLSTMEQVMLKRQTGDSFSRPVGMTNDKMSYQGKTANKNEGGIGVYLNEILMDMNNCFHLIAELTGIDVVGSALSQNSETTATEIKWASASTSDALQPLYTSWVQLKEDAAITAAIKIQRSIKYNPEAKEAYEGILGRSGTKILELGAEKSSAEFGIKLEVRPTEEMKQAAIQAATEALKPGKDGENITLPDWYYFVDMVNRGRPKQAMALLRFRLDKGKQEAITLQRENMELNGQNMVKAQEAKTAGALQEINAQGNIDLKIAAEKALLDMKFDDNSTKNAVLLEAQKALVATVLGLGGETAQPTPQSGNMVA